MSTKLNKDRRKALKETYKSNERIMVLESLPISLETLKELFVSLDKQLENQDCDDTFGITQAFIGQRNLTKNPLIDWLENQGGYCDCEVLANVPEQFEE